MQYDPTLVTETIMQKNYKITPGEFRTCHHKICSLGHIDYFESETPEKQQTQGRHSDLPFSL